MSAEVLEGFKNSLSGIGSKGGSVVAEDGLLCSGDGVTVLAFLLGMVFGRHVKKSRGFLWRLQLGELGQPLGAAELVHRAGRLLGHGRLGLHRTPLLDGLDALRR